MPLPSPQSSKDDQGATTLAILRAELRRRAAREQNTLAPAAWIEKHFYIPETKQPITLALYQRAAIGEALARGADGRYKYSTVLWSDLKKSAKTTIAAAVAAYVAFTKPNARIRFVGNDLKQADSRVFNALTTAIDLNPQWKSEITVRQHTLIFPNGSIIESVPVDPAGEAGGNDDMIEWTELWAATHKAHVKLWNELTLSPTKFGESFRWVDTYAGYSGESEVLESLYKLAVIDGQPLDLGLAGLEVFSNRRFFCLWNTKPLLSWLTPEYYAQEAAMLTDNEFRRLHKNEWVSSSETFVPLEWWTACKVASMPPVERNPVVIALDAGISDDAFAMVAVSRENKQVRVRYAKAWRPPKDGQVDFRNVETELKRLVGIYNVAEVCYDPYQLHDFCKRLQRDGVAFFKEFSQGTDRLIADKSLYDMIRDRTIEHDGNAELTEHIQNANAKTEGDKAMRIVKRSASGKIDCAVALSMANYRICKLVW